MNVDVNEQTLLLARYNQLKFVFKNEQTNFSFKFEDTLNRVSNPYEFFCLCLNLSNGKEVAENKTNSFISSFILEFEQFISKNNVLKLQVTPLLQVKAFKIIKKLNKNNLQNVLINTFLLPSSPEVIIPLLKVELKEKNQISYIISMIKKLKFESHLNANDLIIPLFLQNKIKELEHFIDFFPTLQVEFMSILDGIVGKEIQISDLLYSSDVKEVKGPKSPKMIFKLGLRLMKKYNISPELCPHIMYRHKLSSLRYLFMKYYHLKELSFDSLILFVRELSDNDINLQSEVLDLFVEYNDCFSGIVFMDSLNIPVDCIPTQILCLLKDRNEKEIEKARHLNRQVKILSNNIASFYSLSLPFSSIHQIKTLEEFNNALSAITNYNIIAMDTEWKPALLYNKEEKLTLLQIATLKNVYLFDLLSLQNLLTSNHWNKLGELFSNVETIKLTYSFKGDAKCLGNLNENLNEHLKHVTNVIDFNEVKKTLVDHYPQVFSYINKKPSDFNHKGLSEMVYLCFGKPLNKMEQCSYWSLRPLSHSQIVYAALDAYCLIDIYNYLNENSSKLNIPDWRSITVGPIPVQNKNQSYKNKPYKMQTNLKSHQNQNGPEEKICAKEFKVVCDSMLQGLGKLLRSCNIDTTILGSSDYHAKCIEIYEKDGRIVLTRGNVYHRLKKYVPHSRILSIKSDNVKKQLEEVTKTFGVLIEEHDIFARCCDCNCSAFMKVDPKILIEAKSCKNRPTTSSKWICIDEGKTNFDAHRGVTEKGLKVRFDDVPFGVLHKVCLVYVCGGCGKCYWDGSHMERMRGNLSHVIHRSVPLKSL